MACSSKTGAFYVSGLDEISLSSKSKGVPGFCPSFCFPQPRESNSRRFHVLSVDFLGKPLLVSDQEGSREWRVKTSSKFSVHVCESFSFFSSWESTCFSSFALSELLLKTHVRFAGTSINMYEQSYEVVGKDSYTQYGGDPLCSRTCQFLAQCWW